MIEFNHPNGGGKKMKKKLVYEYGICGTLSGGCSHMYSITRDIFKKLLKRSTGLKVGDYRSYHSRVFDLPFHSSIYLAKGYWYSDMSISVICYPK